MAEMLRVIMQKWNHHQVSLIDFFDFTIHSFLSQLSLTSRLFSSVLKIFPFVLISLHFVQQPIAILANLLYLNTNTKITAFLPIIIATFTTESNRVWFEILSLFSALLLFYVFFLDVQNNI